MTSDDVIKVMGNDVILSNDIVGNPMHVVFVIDNSRSMAEYVALAHQY